LCRSFGSISISVLRCGGRTFLIGCTRARSSVMCEREMRIIRTKNGLVFCLIVMLSFTLYAIIDSSTIKNNRITNGDFTGGLRRRTPMMAEYHFLQNER